MSLHSAKLWEIQRYAKALRVPLRVGNTKKDKQTLIDDIEAKVHASGNLLHANWMTRVNSGINPWKMIFDPVRKYSLSQLQELASKVGIPVLHKTIAELRHDLSEKSKIYGQNEEKEEKNDNRFSTVLANFRPSFNYSSRFTKGQFSLNNLPFDLEM
jgi:hypothetical protein